MCTRVFPGEGGEGGVFCLWMAVRVGCASLLGVEEMRRGSVGGWRLGAKTSGLDGGGMLMGGVRCCGSGRWI